MRVPTIRGVRPALWCRAGAATSSAGGIVVLRDGRAAPAFARANRVVEQALVPLEPGDLLVFCSGPRVADGPTHLAVRRYLGGWVEKRRADGGIEAEIEVPLEPPDAAEAWLETDEGRAFWAACRVYHNRVWPLGS